MDFGLKGKVAIVTGSTQGIGKATAMALAREGASVVICARRQELLDAVAGEIRAAGGQVIGVQADVSRAADCERIVAAAVQAFGRVDILVNNAGTSNRGKFETVPDSVWQADLDLKVFGAIRLIRGVIPEMRKQKGGRIINLTNIGAKQPKAESMPTAVSRAAGLAMTKALSKEYAHEGILVNTVCIGLVRAGQHETTAAKRGIPVEELYQGLAKEIPLGRVGRAEEVANVITFLASEAASFVTGTSVNLDGGASGVL
jgi:NAD(P)-dependent dehydrogenase (short-subunit alcohol dehydrogenase family)